jgi:hypothetical protein
MTMRPVEAEMSRIEARLERIENELRFRLWVSTERMFESMSVEDLSRMASAYRWE